MATVFPAPTGADIEKIAPVCLVILSVLEGSWPSICDKSAYLRHTEVKYIGDLRNIYRCTRYIGFKKYIGDLRKRYRCTMHIGFKKMLKGLEDI